MKDEKDCSTSKQPMKVSDDLKLRPIKPARGALKTWVIERKDGKQFEFEDFEEA